MSEFVMGAEMRITNNFSSPMSQAAKDTETFRQTTETANNAVGKFVNTTTASTQATQQFRDTLEDVAEATQDTSTATREATGNFNRWKSSMQQFNRGTETLKSLPYTLKQIARSKLDGLEHSLISTRLQASLLVGGVNTLAKTKITSTVNSFKEFKTTVTEGKSGLAGFTTGLKNIGKISIAGTYNTMKNLTSKVKEFANTKISNVTNKLKEFKTNASSGEGGVKKLWNALKNAAGVGFSSVHTGISKIGSLAASAGSKVAHGLGSAVKGVTIGLGAAAAAIGGLGIAGIKAGIDYESAFAGVKKTIDATPEQLEVLNNGIRDMAKVMPTTAVEIAGVAEAAGQLGIQTDNVLGFTKTMTMLGDATNMTADDAATTLARFANVTGMSQDNFDRLGSTIVELGNNFATTESEIADMAQNIASAGSQVGMSEAEIMGFSAALSSVGMEAAAGGTAISKLMIDMQLATETGGEGLKDFAKVAGVSTSEFKKAFKEDAAGALSSFLTGLSDTERLGSSAIAVLDDMGITETRLRDTILRAANSGDLFTNALAMGTEAWGENTALAKEAEQRYATMESQIGMLKNSVTDLGIEFYQSVNNPMVDIISTAKDMVGDLSTAFKEGGIAGFVNEVGTVFAKVVTNIADAAPKVVDMAVSLVDSFLVGIEQNAPQIASGAAKAVSAFISGLMELVPRVILVGADLILDFAQGIINQLPQLITTGMTAISTLVNGFISRLPLIVNMALQLIQTLVNGLIANLPMIIQMGLQLLVSLIEGIVSMLPSLVEMGLQIIRSIQESVWSALPQIIQAGVDVLVSLIEGIVQSLPMIIQTAIEMVVSFIQTIIANLPTIIQAAVQIVVALAVGLIQAIPQLVAAIPQLISAIIDTIMSTNWLEVGWDIVKGVGKGLLDGIKGFFGGGEKGGKEVADGAAAGIQNNMGTVSAASLATADTITTGLQPDYSVIEGYGTTATTTLADGFMESSPIAVDAATSITTDMTDTFGEMDLFPTGKNAMEGLNDGLLSMKPTVMGTARSMANSIRNEINSALDIHSPSRVMEESGEYTGEGLIVGINKMINRVRDAARGLGDSVVEPFATQSTSQGSINPSGMVSTPTARTEGLRIMIENIILSDVGDKDPKELVAEILKLLYEALSGADEVLSAGEMGALLT